MSAEAARLVAGLCALRRAADLSLAGLAARTPYSKSSWARYLAGAKPVPRDAVLALCRVAGERPERLLALWELADAEWSGRARTAAETSAGTSAETFAEADTAAPADGSAVVPTPVPWWRAGRTAVLVAGACVLLAGAAGAAAVIIGRASPSASSAASGVGTTGTTYAVGCTGRSCEGQDPAEMGCGGASMVTTPSTRTVDGRRIELRQGEVCHALWVRASRLRLGDRVELSVPGARIKALRADEPAATRGYLATAMTATDEVRGARICLVPRDGKRVCWAG
ncbi:helix-turn-helix domain-containing protein [Streptomyces sp. NPDC058001]|uniref:helix-turn-helix domain-containing protein n=1 Tax=Streptomyces sp. NPDC058001 TaxID=3346300 RepID=UPI0036EDE2D1